MWSKFYRMSQPDTRSNQHRALPGTRIIVLLSVLLLASFFLNWTVWETSKISGFHFPTGEFFAVGETKFGLANPVPELNVANNVFWLIPVLALVTAILALLKKRNVWLPVIAGILTLSLATVFVLFTDLLVMLGAVKSVTAALMPFFYLAVVTAILLILISLWRRNIFLAIIALLIGPFATWAAFAFVTNQEMNKTFEGTESLKPDFTVNALDLIREVAGNDTASNRKYSGKILEVNGRITTIENANDSTINIQMADSTSGSYIVFPFYNKTLEQVKTLHEGDSIAVKGAFTGSMYSEILETTIINFERNTLNKQNKQKNN